MWPHERLGYNYRIDEIRSALGLAQLDKLPANNVRRQEISARYRQLLAGTEIHVPFTDPADSQSAISACHIFPILLPEGTDRKAFIDSLRAAGIQTSIHYPPIHQFSYYRERYPDLELPITEALARREVTLPLYPGMTDQMVDLVASAVKHALQ